MEKRGHEMDIIGIDIGKRKFDVAWLSMEKVRNKVFDNTASGHQALLIWLKSKGIETGHCHIAMEATSQYYEALAEVLYAEGYTVSVVNPLQIKAFGESLLRRQKTDRADAGLIARFCAQTKPLAWQPPAAEVRELQRLLSRLEAVQGMHVQEQNRRYEAQGIALESVERMLGTLKEEEKRLEQMIRDHIKSYPELSRQHELLQSIPGVGEKVSSYFFGLAASGTFYGYSPSGSLCWVIPTTSRIWGFGARQIEAKQTRAWSTTQDFVFTGDVGDTK